MATPFQTFVNGELPKRPFTQDAAVAWTPGRVVVTTGVGLGVTTEVFPAPPVTSVNSSTGAVVITADSLSAIPTSQKGAASGVASLDASGFVPMSQMNPGVVERLYVVTDETARFALTTSQVQNGDVVKQELPAPAAMYYVQDDTNLDSELGYAIFAVGTAAAVAWSGVTGVPQILLDLENISGAVTGDILQFDGTNWVKQSRNAYVSGLALQVSEIDGLQNDLDGKQDHDLTLDALSDLPDTGFIVQIAPDSFASRSLEAGDGISITFPDGVGGDPLIALRAGPNTAEGVHGDENTYLGLDIDSHGRTTAVTEYKLQKDIVYIPNSTDPFPLTTKTLYMIGDFLTTTYGDLYLQLPPLTASTIIEIQLAFNIEQVGHVYLIPSGTDLVFGEGTPLDLKDLPLAPGCTVKLFFHSVGLVGWIGQANYGNHLIAPKIHPFNAFNAASWAASHRIISESTGDWDVTIPDANIDLGHPITLLSFDRSTDVLTGTRVDGLEVTTLLGQNHMDELLSPDGGLVGVPLLVGRTYRPAGSVAIYSPDTPVYLPTATADAFNSHESVPIRLMTGNSILNAGYLRLTPQVGETMYHSDINGSIATSTYLPIPNNSEVTCYMIGVGKWYVDIRQDSNYLDTDHFTLVDPVDRTKSVVLNVAPVDVGTQRVITVPDADVSLGKVPTGVTPTYTTGRLMVPLADGTSLPLSAFGGTRLANLSSPATVLTANGHYLFYSNTGSYYTAICGLALPTAPADMTYVRISNISSLGSFSVGAGATVAPGGADKINGVAATLDITDYLVNYRNAVITFTYSTLHENWTVSVLGDLIKPGTVEIYDADKTNTTTLTPVTNLTTNRVITLPDANVDLGKVLSNISYAPTTGVITLTNVDASTFATTNTGAIADDVLRIQSAGDATRKMGFDASTITAGQTRIVTMPNVDTTMATSKYVILTASATNQTLAIGGRYAIPVGYAGILNLVLPTGSDGDTIEIADPYNVQRTLTGGNGVNVTPTTPQYIQYSTTTTTDIVGDLRSAFAVLLTYSATNTRWELTHISRNVPMNNTDGQEYYQDGALVRRKGCLYVPAAAFFQSGSGFVGTDWVSLGVHKEPISANKTLIINSSYYMRAATPTTAYTLTLPEPYTLPSASFDGAIIEIDCLEYTGLLSFNTAGWTNAAANGATNGWRQGPDYEADLVPISSRTIQCAKGMKIRFRKVQIGTVHYWFIDLGRPSDSAFSIADSTDSTRLMGFNASAIAAGQRRVVTMPDANVDLGNVAVSVATTSLKMGGNSATSMSGAYNTVLGYGSATSLTSGTGNTIVGHAAAPTLTSSNNTIMGYLAGNLTTSSTRNTLIGNAAGYLSNAADRTCIGAESGGSCGASCVVVGSLANSAGTGKNTTSIGYGSGAYASGSSGEGWVAIGYQAAYHSVSAITASNWVTIGIDSGQNQNTPDWVAIGANALRSSTARANTGIVCIGTDTTRDSTNSWGVAIGYQAGYGTVANNRSDGDTYGIYIGFRASRDSTVPAATALSDCLAIGRSATVSTSNTYILGSSSVGINVGICMITATARLHLPAGATPAGKAPLKFTSGALQTTAEAGAIEYNNAYYATASDAVRRPISLSNAAVLPSNITVTASPMTYQNATGYNADVIISGGTVSSIEFTRDNTTFYTTGLTTGVITLSPSDRVRVTYTTVAPTMTLVPR